MENSDSPSIFAAKKILVLHFLYDCTTNIETSNLCYLFSANCLSPGSNPPPLCLTTLLSRTSKREQKIQSSPRLHMTMSKWLYVGEFQEYISYCRTLYWLIHLFILFSPLRRTVTRCNPPWRKRVSFEGKTHSASWVWGRGQKWRARLGLQPCDPEESHSSD